MRQFANGNVYWSSATGAFEVHGAILARYLANGGPTGALGFPKTNETTTPDTVGRYNHFQNGSLYYFPWANAYLVRGEIRDKWASMGWENSILGYPLSDETFAPDGQGRFNHFQYGSIYSHPSFGTHFLNGGILRLLCWIPPGFPSVNQRSFPVSIKTASSLSRATAHAA